MKLLITKKSKLFSKNVLIASFGVSTIGSFGPLKLVFNKTGTFVFS
jgi:hypothetical protein